MALVDARKTGQRYTEIDNFSLPTVTIRDFLAMFKTHSKLFQTTPKSPNLLLFPRETEAPYSDRSILSLNPRIELDFLHKYS